MSHSKSSLPSIKSSGVHLIGDFVSNCGLSQSARDVRDVFMASGIPVEVLDLPLFPEREDEKKALGAFPLDLPVPASAVSIVNVNADYMPMIAAMLPRRFFENRYVIGIWFWETEIFPPHHLRGLDFVDEVWVASAHIREALEKATNVPIRQFTQLIHPSQPAGPEQLPASLRNDRFVFLFCFNYGSMAERKNPAGTCEAFIKAFPVARPDGPLCVIKSAGTRPHHILEHLDLVRQYQHRPDIIFLDGWLSQPQRDALMNRAGCYVSLHRAEGLGLTILESMALGKPCIGTAYSGNMDFMTGENSWLIPGPLVSVGPHRWPYSSHHRWADPDLDAAAAAMQEAVSRPDVLQKKGAMARSTALGRHSIQSAGASFSPLLEQALAAKPRLKPGLQVKDEPEASLRDEAYRLLKDARQQQKNTASKAKQAKGLLVPPAIRETLSGILEVQRLQLEIHRNILKEIGQIKAGLTSYSPGMFDRTVLGHQHCAQLIDDLSQKLNSSHGGQAGG